MALLSSAFFLSLLLGVGCLSLVQSFAPSSSAGFIRSVQSTCHNKFLQPVTLSVSLSPVGDAIGADDESDDDEPAPEDFIVSAGDLDDEPTDGEEVEEEELPGWFEHKQRLLEVRTKYRRHETDTGSPEFQVAGMTERIMYLTKHLKVHPKDFSTRRGLVALVNKRRRLLNYLFREDANRYTEVVSSLGIRHKAPSRVQTREEKYGRFPPQKERRK